MSKELHSMNAWSAKSAKKHTLLNKSVNGPLECAIEDLIQNNNLRGNEALEASLRNASLLDLSEIIGVDTNFNRDLKFIYKNIRFSIDISTLCLIRQTKGRYWEYKFIVEKHKLNGSKGWIKIPAHLSASVEAVLNVKIEVEKTQNPQLYTTDRFLKYLFHSQNIHFESFRYDRGGILFIPSEELSYNQVDRAYLSNIASIISFCVEKDVSSRFLSDVYNNLESIAEQAKNNTDQYCIGSIPAAYLDKNSGLPNQTGFLRLADHLIDSNQVKFHLVVLSLDKFAYFCNLFNESTKEEFLSSTIQRIQNILKNNSSLSHINNSELAFTMLENDQIKVEKAISEIINAFCEDLQVNDITVRFEISAGYATYPNCGSNATALLKLANVALYRATQKTSNKYVCYTAGMDKELKLHIELGRSIRQAIKRQEFAVFFQPIVHVQNSDDICHYEALVRWVHPEEGTISPALFIEIAEASGDIIHLGYWVTEKVCEHLSHPHVPNHLKVSINLSPVQIKETLLAQNMRDILQRYAVDPSRISFEITETAAMLDPGLTGQRFEELKRAGFELSVDDFGTGHSSLSYLLHFSFKYLKIDKSFIDQSGSNHGYAVMASSMIQLAHKLNMIVICEGIETLEQHQMVKEWGTDMLQGYLISRPMPIHHYYPLAKL